MRGLGVAALLLLLSGCAASPAPDAREHVGFVMADLPPAESEWAGVDVLGVDGVTISADGSSVAEPSDAALVLLAEAQDRGIPAILLVSNFSNDLQDFDSAAAAALLEDPQKRADVIAALADTVEADGWNGVMIDLESMTAADTAGLTSFTAELRAALGDGIRLDIALMAAADADGYAAWGYDLSALADLVDVATLMTYDQHGPWSDAGPVGALGWQREVTAAALEQWPADRLDLGIAAYGYGWGPSAPESVTDASARALVEADGSEPTWDEEAGEWTALLSDGTRLWWADARSAELREALAAELGLRGTATWALGLEG
jgi:spore germination protein YaaH